MQQFIASQTCDNRIVDFQQRAIALLEFRRCSECRGPVHVPNNFLARHCTPVWGHDRRHSLRGPCRMPCLWDWFGDQKPLATREEFIFASLFWLHGESRRPAGGITGRSGTSKDVSLPLAQG